MGKINELINYLKWDCKRIIAKMAMLDSKRHPLSDQVQGVPRNMTALINSYECRLPYTALDINVFLQFSLKNLLLILYFEINFTIT